MIDMDWIRLIFYILASYECGILALELYKYWFGVRYNKFILPMMLHVASYLLLFVFLSIISVVSHWYPEVIDWIRNSLIFPVLLIALSARFARVKLTRMNNGD